MNFVDIICINTITLSVLEMKSGKNMSITLEKDKKYKGIEKKDVFSLYDETQNGDTLFYQMDIQEAIKVFRVIDCSVIVGSGETKFRLRPEEYKGYSGTYRWNAQAQIYEGEVLDIEEEITYTGKDLFELNNSFKVAVDTYLTNHIKETDDA